MNSSNSRTLRKLFITTLLALTTQATAKEKAPIKDYAPLDRAAKVVSKCFTGKPSPDPELGCVDSLKQLHEHCVESRRNFWIRKRSMHEIFQDAKYCPLVDNSFGYITLNNYFELDEQTCIRGYETTANKLASFYANSEMLRLEEPFAYDFEKASCKNLKKYVHFCAYVDGDLKNNTAVSAQHLPPLEQYLEQKKFCPTNMPPNDPGYGVSEIDNLLYTFARKNEPDAYLKAIQTFRDKRKRGVASATSGESESCKNIRGTYANLNCQKWEKVTDEESIYYDLDDFRSRRLKKSGKGSSSN